MWWSVVSIIRGSIRGEDENMRYCPKDETWIHVDGCKETKECYDLVDWASCYRLRRKVGSYASK